MDVLSYIRSLPGAVRDQLLPVAGRIPALTLSRARLVRLHKGEQLIHMGDPFEEVFVLCRGSLRTVAHEMNGDDSFIDQFSAPAIFGEMELFVAANSYMGSIVATERSELIAVKAHDWQAWILSDPEILYRRSRWLVAKLVAQSQFERAMLGMYGTDRVMYAILHKCRSISLDADIELRMSQKDLAERVKMSTKTVSRALDDLTEQGLLSMKGRVICMTSQQRQSMNSKLSKLLHNKLG